MIGLNPYGYNPHGQRQTPPKCRGAPMLVCSWTCGSGGVIAAAVALLASNGLRCLINRIFVTSSHTTLIWLVMLTVGCHRTGVCAESRDSSLPSYVSHKICVIHAFSAWKRASPLYNNSVLNRRSASRVTKPRIEARSANLVGETKVDSGSLSLPRMCAGINPSQRTKSPLMAFAQPANRHDAFISYSA